MAARELTELLVAAQANSIEQVACTWVRSNANVWSGWLRKSERPGADDKSWVLYLFVSALTVVLTWLCLPLTLRRSSATSKPNYPSLEKVKKLSGEYWETWSAFPGLAHELVSAGVSAVHSTRKVCLPCMTKVAPNVVAETGVAEVDGRNGVQFASRTFYGAEAQEVKLALVRDVSVAHEPVRLVIRATDGFDTKTGRDFDLGEPIVEMAAGETCKLFTQLLNHRTKGALDKKAGIWQPTRSFQLSLNLVEGSPPCAFGTASTCTVTIVDLDDWPTPGASKMSARRTYFAFVYEVWAGNFENETWWLVGVIARACHANYLTPLLMIYFFDDAIANADVELAMLLACFKLCLLLVDQYTSFFYTSNHGICCMSVWAWVFSKWNSLPLDACLDHERLNAYLEVLERCDGEFSSKTYNFFTRFISLLVNLTFSLAVAYQLAPNSYYLLYAAYAIALVVVFGLVSQMIPKNIAGIHDAYWKFNALFKRKAEQLLLDIIPIRYMHMAAAEATEMRKVHADRMDMTNQKYYINCTQQQYTEWVMRVPEILIFAAAPLFIEFGTFKIGELIAILGSFAAARGKMVQLCSMKDECLAAEDMMKDLSELLCALKSQTDRQVLHMRRAMELIASKGAPKLELLTSISLHDVEYTSAGTNQFMGANLAIERGRGAIKLGQLYGIVQQADMCVETARVEFIMDLIGGLRTPQSGVVLAPPHAKVIVVPRRDAIMERGTIYENLVYGLPPEEAESLGENNVWGLCRALGMSETVFSKATGDEPMLCAQSPPLPLAPTPSPRAPTPRLRTPPHPHRADPAPTPHTQASVGLHDGDRQVDGHTGALDPQPTGCASYP